LRFKLTLVDAGIAAHRNDTEPIRRRGPLRQTYFKRTITPPTAADTSASIFELLRDSLLRWALYAF
jgi:hypothetical protein